MPGRGGKGKSSKRGGSKRAEMMARTRELIFKTEDQGESPPARAFKSCQRCSLQAPRRTAAYRPAVYALHLVAKRPNGWAEGVELGAWGSPARVSNEPPRRLALPAGVPSARQRAPTLAGATMLAGSGCGSVPRVSGEKRPGALGGQLWAAASRLVSCWNIRQARSLAPGTSLHQWRAMLCAHLLRTAAVSRLPLLGPQSTGRFLRCWGRAASAWLARTR